jgi:hypothetical protein
MWLLAFARCGLRLILLCCALPTSISKQGTFAARPCSVQPWCAACCKMPPQSPWRHATDGSISAQARYGRALRISRLSGACAGERSFFWSARWSTDLAHRTETERQGQFEISFSCVRKKGMAVGDIYLFTVEHRHLRAVQSAI